MANRRHLSRLAVPKSWPIKRKGIKWISRPLPGAHTLGKSMPVAIFLKEILGLARNNAEVKRVLHEGLVLINGKAVKDLRSPLGLFDTLKILKYNKTFRVLLNTRGKLMLKEIPDAEARLRPMRVNSKTTVKGGKIQVNFSNGWNLLTEKDEYKVNDVLIFDTSAKKLVKHLKLETGNLVYITGGAHSGKLSEIKKILQEGVLRKKKFILASHKEEKLKVPIEEVFVLGQDKPEISVP